MPPAQLPLPHTAPSASLRHRLRAAWRLAALCAHTGAAWYTMSWRWQHKSAAQRHAYIIAWARRALHLCGAELVHSGQAPCCAGVLLVSNHISWLDILALHALHPYRFVSKAEVARWPLIGKLATGAQTLYLQRSSRQQAHRVAHHMAQLLHEQAALAIFPEGTTGCGQELLPFHGNLLQAAISAHALVQPAALCYLGANAQPTRIACYVGADTLLASLWRTLCAPQPLRIVVRLGATQSAQNRSRRQWAHDLHKDVAQLLSEAPGALRP